jgi:hypothetical protein
MTHIVKKLHQQRIINAYFDFHVIEGRPGKLKWDKGILTYKNRFEVMLYHLIKFKKIYNPSKVPEKIPDKPILIWFQNLLYTGNWIAWIVDLLVFAWF